MDIHITYPPCRRILNVDEININFNKKNEFKLRKISMINRLQIDAYTFLGLEPGLSVLILGGVHGDEICGTKAINQVIRLINNGKINIKSGKITMIPVTNPLAARKKNRIGDRNLNRCFYLQKKSS